MFTGIIEDLGTVKKISKTQIAVETKLDDIKIGDSVCFNGVCLTVSNFIISQFYNFTADVSEETFKKTNLGELKIGSIVNLERALKTDGRLGGHFVTGHVDGTGKILKIKIIKNGNLFAESFSDTAIIKPDGKGVYRCECYLKKLGFRPWIFSNPIFI